MFYDQLSLPEMDGVLVFQYNKLNLVFWSCNLYEVSLCQNH